MLSFSFSVASALSLAVVVTGRPRPLGLPCHREFPCAAPEVCVPTDPSCEDLDSCFGRCVIESPLVLPQIDPIEPTWIRPRPPPLTLDPTTAIVLTTPPPEFDPIPFPEPEVEPIPPQEIDPLDWPIDTNLPFLEPSIEPIPFNPFVGLVWSEDPPLNEDPVVDPIIDPSLVAEILPEEEPQVDPLPPQEIDPLDWPIDTSLPFLEPSIEPIPFNPIVGLVWSEDPPIWPVDTDLPAPEPVVEPVPFNPDIDIDTTWPIDSLPWPETDYEPIPFNPEIEPFGPFDPPPFPDVEPVLGPLNEYPSCGGFRRNPPPCPEGSYCATDPRDPWAHLIADLPGICISRDAKFCGGFAGLECPEGLSCYDYPSDGCHPRRGGSDCIGICL